MSLLEHKTQTKMHHGNAYKREPFGFVPRMFGFIQPGCYASIVNKTNFRYIIPNNMYTSLFLIFQNTNHI